MHLRGSQAALRGHVLPADKDLQVLPLLEVLAEGTGFDLICLLEHVAALLLDDILRVRHRMPPRSQRARILAGGDDVS